MPSSSATIKRLIELERSMSGWWTASPAESETQTRRLFGRNRDGVSPRSIWSLLSFCSSIRYRGLASRRLSSSSRTRRPSWTSGTTTSTVLNTRFSRPFSQTIVTEIPIDQNDSLMLILRSTGSMRLSTPEVWSTFRGSKSSLTFWSTWSDTTVTVKRATRFTALSERDRNRFFLLKRPLRVDQRLCQTYERHHQACKPLLLE